MGIVMRTPDNVLKIGILNLMHDKKDTKSRFEKVLQSDKYQVETTFYYPKDHYKSRPVPEDVKEMSRPLDLDEIKHLDGFIITGAPLEKLDFTEITYINELQELFECLEKNKLEQLYICWGAMAAANYFYDIDKVQLPQKIFGLYPQEILNDSKMLRGMRPGFLAPHARYADIDLAQVAKEPELKVSAQAKSGEAFLIEAPNRYQTFLFSHLEYGRNALKKEYVRELAVTKPKDVAALATPQNYYQNGEPQFLWDSIQKHFFANWLDQVHNRRKARSKAKKLVKN